MYGPSECTDIAIARVYERHAAAAYEVTLPIGRPIYNCSAYVLNDRMQLQPRGVVGELYIGGVGVSNGYINQEALNRRCFVDNAIAGAGRLYRTGDLAQILPDGSFHYVGRADHQVKIRGYRVETAEVDAVISECPGIEQSVTIALEGDAGEKSLVCFVVVEELQALTQEQSHAVLHEVRARLVARLPAYMIPSKFMPLPALPLTPNGKVDRLYLASELAGGPFWQLHRELRPPRNAIEAQLLKIWQALLGREDVGIDDDFFELGGHSVLVARLHGSLKEHFAINVPVRSLYAHQTLVKQATVIEGYLLTQQATPETQGELVVEEL
jgi:acyl-CoA synthetase (AMP-forming)/AMP-acid ligase II/acyl carrier protein